MKNTRLKEVIWQKNLTQKRVAVETGVRPEHLSMAVNGKLLLNRAQRLKIAVFLGMPESELFPIETHLQEVAHKLNPGVCG